jgi:molybdopterin-guanine dinucleotide biosynthesis protein B
MNRAPLPSHTPIVAIVGWKKSGKTTLTVRLVAEMVARGRRVATVKHAHHNFQIDEAATDSARHRQAGAHQVAVVSAERVAMIKELNGAPEPDFEDVIAMLDPCDLIVVEGYKSAPLAPRDPRVIAVAADHPADGAGRPVYSLDDIEGLADLIEKVVMEPDAATRQSPAAGD